MSDKREAPIAKPYLGPLTCTDAANGIRAARLNALDLLDTAYILFTLKRFAHSSLTALPPKLFSL
jgi:hypothetical protein